MEELSTDFEKAISQDLIIYAFSEGRALEEKRGTLVPYASSQRLAGANNYMVEDANHFTICRPPTKDHPSYSKLVECLKFCLKVNINFIFHVMLTFHNVLKIYNLN
jgi:hypothetical protein